MSEHVEQQPAAVARYVWRYTIVYSLAVLATAAVLLLLDIQGNAGAAMGAVVIGVVAAAILFVKEQRRVPTPAERGRLVAGSLLTSWLISLLLFALFIVVMTGFEGLRASLLLLGDYQLHVLIGVVAVSSALHALVLWFFYGLFAKQQLRALQQSDGA